LEGAVNGKTATSNIDGIAEIIKIHPEGYNASVSLTGYATQSFKVTIVRGKVTELEVKMAK
jgi:hypothetical protein